MNYEMFQDALAEEVKRLAGEGAVVSLQQMQKNNGVTLYALCIQKEGENLAPLIYLDGFYQRYRKGVPIAHLAKLLLAQYREVPREQVLSLDDFKDFRSARNHIFCRIVNYDLNAPSLCNVPHKRYLDLAVTYYYKVDHPAFEDATITVTHAHQKLWNVTDEELHLAAWENTTREAPPLLESMEEALSEFLSDEEKAEIREVSGSLAAPVPMYILSNSSRCMGAICIMYPGTLAGAAEQFQSDLYILPSSIHECILVPGTESFTREELAEMVETINATQLEPQEILSNHVYFYNRSTDTIQM